MKFRFLSFLFAWITATAAAHTTKLGECEYDCDRDRDCQDGLLCADKHKSELGDANLDVRKAYCGRVGRWKDEVCYDPNKVGVQGNVHDLDVAIFFLEKIKTCYVGSEVSDPSEENCRNKEGVLRDNSNQIVHCFEDDFRSVPTTHPDVSDPTWTQVCLDLECLTGRTLAEEEVQLFCDKVAEWTGNHIKLTPHFIRIPEVDIGMGGYGDSTWVHPNSVGLKDILVPELDFLPDFTFVVHGHRSYQDPVDLNVGGYGGLANVYPEFAGAGYSTLPYCGSSYSYYMHEWLHLLQFAFLQRSDFAGGEVPPPNCGLDCDPKTWFPNLDSCGNADPDFECTSNVNDWYEHILRVHYDPNVNFVASYCKNAEQDDFWPVWETGIDEGGECAIGNDYVPS